MVEGAEGGDVNCEDTDDGCSVSVASTYMVQAQISFNAAGGATKTFQWAVFKEGVVVNNCKTYRAAASVAGSASIVCTVAASANDTFDLRVMNVDDTTNVEVNHAHLVITRIGA
jgi:hypothetical protein